MRVDTPFLLDEGFADDDFMPDMSATVDAIRTTTDPYALGALAELLEHSHPSVRAAAVEALRALHPSSLELRRQLSPVAVMRVRAALGLQRTRKTRNARAKLVPRRDEDEDDE
jgi:HEAT repeat protein